jgi:hypothetical protein
MSETSRIPQISRLLGAFRWAVFPRFHRLFNLSPAAAVKIAPGARADEELAKQRAGVRCQALRSSIQITPGLYQVSFSAGKTIDVSSALIEHAIICKKPPRATSLPLKGSTIMKSPVNIIRLLLMPLLLILISFHSINAQDDYPAMKSWESFDFAAKTITPADLSALSIDDLKLVRGIVFGKHGRVFKDSDIRRYLESRSWYKANANFQNSALTDTERANLDVIRIAEAEKHDTVQPGDMRLYEDRALTRKKLGQHTNAEWTVLAAEIQAIHGRRFDGTPWLQQYFDERYWYRPADHYDPKSLSAIERKNLQLIDTVQRQQRRVALAPGDMELFENKLIAESMLRGLSLHELRLLRNEIYARHGRVFKTTWLDQYFGSQPWYDPNPDFKDEELSGPDKTNVETIVAYENKLHNQITTKPITNALLQGLFLEDVRKMRDEIYARHGKVFKDPWTQKYFASFDWYKANPNYSDAALSPVEKGNVAVIAAYEKKAVTAMSTIEG